MTALEIQAQIDAITTAIATGVLRIQIDGMAKEYRSAKDMQNTLAWLQGQLAIVNGTKPRARQYRMYQSSKGI